jgi:NAD(P)-dependent dehydrogenase (short-subunit alcohol dehydrogenase family)
VERDSPLSVAIDARDQGKVAFITGAARGQGRSHAVRLAEEGADIIAVDICEDVATVPYGGATEEDLAETAKQVEALDRRIVARKADVRDLANLTGVWKTVKATAPGMVERGQGGSIILTSSIAGLIAFPLLAHYTAAKHGVTGLMRTLAVELAPHNIRVNSVHPTTVDTPMVANEAIWGLFLGGVQGATREQAAGGMTALNAMRVPWVEARDISNAVLYLASDEARYVTGTTTVIDAGAMQPFKIPHSV